MRGFNYADDESVVDDMLTMLRVFNTMDEVFTDTRDMVASYCDWETDQTGIEFPPERREALAKRFEEKHGAIGK